MGFLDHEGGAEFPYHKDDVFDAIVQSISTIKGMKVDKSDKLSGHILVKAGISLMSWGENIPMSLSEVSFGRTRVSVTSTPKTGALFGGAFDLGKNRRNIENILEATSKILSRKAPVKADSLSQTENLTPAQRMAQLKELLDKGLISVDEFEKKKDRYSINNVKTLHNADDG